ncbi:MAG: DUF883 family protein [Xanthomonadales bacterium]|nr:DUF883 family protein [Xanthomonadales bacterium]
MNNQDSPSESKIAGSRIDEHAERVKQATSKAVAGTKEAVDRAAERVDHAADRVEESLHRTTDKAAGAAHRASDKAADLGERGREAYARTADQTEAWLEAAREYVREKPVQSVAIALGAGWLLGRILRR